MLAKRQCTVWLSCLPAFLAVGPLAGCWAGGMAPARNIAYRHPAVQWVYQAGG